MKTAGQLLAIYTFPIDTHEQGITKHSEYARDPFKLLAEKLSQLDSTEPIQIETNEHVAKYIFLTLKEAERRFGESAQHSEVRSSGWAADETFYIDLLFYHVRLHC